MASSHDFFITGDHTVGRAVVAQALESQRYTVTATPNGGYLARRGNTALTVLFGGLAGPQFQVTLLVDFMVASDGALIARIYRQMAGGALKGGAIGASITNNAFLAATDAIGQALDSAQILTAHTNA